MHSLKDFITVNKKIQDLKSKGHLNLKREEMPQCPFEKLDDLKLFLTKNKIEYDTKNENPENLKLAQCEINPEKVLNLLDKINDIEKPIIISKEGYVLDGNHTFVAHLIKNRPIIVLQIKTSVENCIDKLHDFDHSFTKKINESLTKT